MKLQRPNFWAPCNLAFHLGLFTGTHQLDHFKQNLTQKMVLDHSRNLRWTQSGLTWLGNACLNQHLIIIVLVKCTMYLSFCETFYSWKPQKFAPKWLFDPAVQWSMWRLNQLLMWDFPTMPQVVLSGEKIKQLLKYERCFLADTVLSCVSNAV